MLTNATHDPDLRSWVTSANAPDHAFPVQNLPLGVVRRRHSKDPFHVAIAIGDFALDLSALHGTGLCSSVALEHCLGANLNDLMALDSTHWSRLRADLSTLLTAGNPNQHTVQHCLIPLPEIQHDVPARIGDYTDFYTSIHHATNIGKLFRPDNPLLPNYQWVPIGYHGRSSSIIISGEPIKRPTGQIKSVNADQPTLAPCQKLDYELELGIFVGTGNALGEPISIADAQEHLFGLCLLNDWSARDIQAWEYQPLGPFLGKSFATTLSPWVITAEALAPFRKGFARESSHPQPLPYLSSMQNSRSGSYDINLEVLLKTEQMHRAGNDPVAIATSNYQDAYWTAAQLLAHHSSNGCNLRPGDLLGTGTLSGAGRGSEGALIESTLGGTRPIVLANGEQRGFLEDGDTVTLRARCERPGFVGIGFGEAIGTVDPA